MTQLSPLDAYINGYSFQNALMTMSILAEGKKAGVSIPPSMLATLDNFVKLVLFHEKIHITFDTGEQGEIKRGFSGDKTITDLIIANHDVFSILTNDELSNVKAANRTDKLTIIQSISQIQHMHFVISCEFPGLKSFQQELLNHDLDWMESAITLGGLEHFKPIFPGENFYLGYRQSVLRTAHQPKTIVDEATKRIRALAREEIEHVNQMIMDYGGVPMPCLPPFFVVRILETCKDGPDFFPKLLQERNSPTITNFRKWAADTSNSILHGNPKERAKATNQIKALEELTFDRTNNKGNWLKLLINTISAVVKPDPSAIAGAASSFVDVFPGLMKWFRGNCFSGLVDIGNKKNAGNDLKRFFEENLKQTYSDADLQLVSEFLSLPYNAEDWGKLNCVFKAQGGRIDPTFPILSRYCQETTTAPDSVAILKDWFDGIWNASRRPPKR